MEFHKAVKFVILAHLLSHSLQSTEAGSLVSVFHFPPPAPSKLPNSAGLQYTHRQILNDDHGSVLEWTVENSTIFFTLTTSLGNVENEDNLVVLLGLSKSGRVDGSDVVALKLNHVDEPDLVDMHGVDKETLVADKKQNWKLVSFKREGHRISLRVGRLVNTCDNQDLAIKTDLIRVIWGFGEANPNEKITSLHFRPSGNISLYLLDPTVKNPASVSGNQIQSWRLGRRFQLPAQATTYWCTIHRGLKLNRKHHIVGYGPYFKDEVSKRHVHHVMMYRCVSKIGVEASQMFEKFVGHPGEECYLEDMHRMPTVFCTELITVYGVGEKLWHFPENLGIPIGENKNEYYMLETHYNNPENIPGIVVEHGFDIKHTPQLRPKEGTIIFVGYGVFGLFQIPPHAKKFQISGHCSESCMRQMIPDSGLNIVAGGVHSHIAGRKITLRHFHGKRELPWVLSDRNYDFDIQQFRLLPKPVKLLPGDQLTVQCEMDTRDRNGSTVAGYSTEQEMCTSFIVLDKRIPHSYCVSEYPTDKILARYGINKAVWNKEKKIRIVTDAVNQRMLWQPVTKVMDGIDGKWSDMEIRKWEREQFYGLHDATCNNERDLYEVGHALDHIDNISGGLIPTGEMVKRYRVTTRTMSTPIFPGFRSAQFPRNVELYKPPAPVCVA